jgi:hypothetical protein
MRRVHVISICVVAVVAIGTALASAFSGQSGLFGLSASSPSSAAASDLTPGGVAALETVAYERHGLSPARARRAVEVQGQIGGSGVASRLEATMSGDYGGVWYSPASAQLHVGVASPAGRRSAERVLTQTGLTGNTVLTPVRSTWAQLLTTQSKWNHRLEGLFAREEAETGLIAASNALAVTVGPSVSSTERAALEREAAVAPVNVSVTVAPYKLQAFAEGSSCSVFTKEKAYCNKTLTSGVRIESQSKNEGPEVCTAGPMVIPKASKNETYVLTSGHCISQGYGVGVKWYAYNRAGTKEEIGTATEYIFATKGDVGAIKINNPGYWALSGSDPVLADTALWTKKEEASYPVVGEQVPMLGTENCHEGQTSGESCGSVLGLSQTLTYNGAKVEGLISDVGGIGEGGDSGGPWLSAAEKLNNNIMEGVHDALGNNGRLYYEPLNRSYSLLSKLDPELLTTATETR